MTRPFLAHDEFAVFLQPQDMEGVNSARVQGPRKTALDAYLEAEKGYDTFHFTRVIRVNLDDRHAEDVTDEVGDELAYHFAKNDLPESCAPAFVDRSEIETLVGGMRREWISEKRQEVA